MKKEILAQKMDGPNLFSEKLSASQVPDVDSTVVRLTDANIARNSKGFSQKHGSCLLFSASRIFTSPNCLQKKSHVDMATFSCANKIAVLHTESRLPFFSGTTLLQLDLHQGSDQQPQLMVIGSSDPKCKKNNMDVWCKNRSLRSRCRTCDSTNTHIISHEYRQAGDVEQQKSRRF